MTDHVHVMKADSEFAGIVAGSKKVCVDFSASWCGPCKKISPIFHKLSAEAKYKDVKFVNIDVDECPETAQECGISAMPTFQFFVNGKKIDELMGASEGKLIELLDKGVAA